MTTIFHTENARESLAQMAETISAAEQVDYKSAFKLACSRQPKAHLQMIAQENAIFADSEPVTPEPKRDAQFSASVTAHFSAGVAHVISTGTPDAGFAAAAEELAEREGVTYEVACARVKRRYPQLHAARVEAYAHFTAEHDARVADRASVSTSVIAPWDMPKEWQDAVRAKTAQAKVIFSGVRT